MTDAADAPFSKDHRLCGSAQGQPECGNPKDFFGQGIVAFLDILGFSEEVARNWGEHHHSALRKLLRMKVAIPNDSWQIRFSLYSRKPGDIATYACRICTLSDSIAISVALPEKVPWAEFSIALMSCTNNIIQVWKACIREGFTLRGGLEIGPVYWSGSEIIGPALGVALDVEKKLANSSRVMIGPRLTQALIQLYPSYTRDNGILSPLPFMCVDGDGAVVVNPGFLTGNRNDDPEGLVKALESMQANCAFDEKRANKYMPLLYWLRQPENIAIPTIDNLKQYLSRFIIKEFPTPTGMMP